MYIYPVVQSYLDTNVPDTYPDECLDSRSNKE